VEEQNQTAGDPEMSDICGCGQDWAMDKDMDMDACIESGGCQIFNSNVNFAYARTVKCSAALGAAAETNPHPKPKVSPRFLLIQPISRDALPQSILG